MAEQYSLQKELKKIRRAENYGWIFILIGIFIIAFGYTVYDQGLHYSGLMVMTMGVVSIAFGIIVVSYSRRIV